MSKPAGNPRHGRRLRGIPRAGDLTINGRPAPKGNLPAQVRRIYQSARRSLATTSAPADLTIVQVGEPDMAGHTICEWCSEYLRLGDTIAYEHTTGRWWHMDPWLDGTSCRAKWITHQTDTPT